MKTRYTEVTGEAQHITKLIKKIGMPIDELVERAEIALDMFPDKLHINIVITGSAKEVQEFYKQKYSKDCDYIAFISLGSMTIYLSIKDVTLDVLSHELGHAIAELYFTERPPYKIHELLAQYCAKHILD